MKYAIFEGNMDRLTKKMTRIQNKCRKYGCDFRFEQVGEEYKELTDTDGNKYMARFVDVEAEGIAQINGWRFIASLQHTANGNIINKAVDDVEVPERYYTGRPCCEHCQTDRYRKDTYIVMNQETGEFKQVGKSCLKDFTRGMSTEAVAEYTSAFDSLIEAETPYPGCGDICSYIETVDFLHYVAECIRIFGYIKRDYEDSSVISTKDRAEHYYFTDHGFVYGHQTREEFKAEMQEAGFNPESEYAVQLTEKALAWIAEQTEDNNYMHNLKVACSLEYQDGKNLGIIASLFPTYNRELERQAQIEAQKTAVKESEYVDSIGDRIEVQIADYRCVTSWSTQWGCTGIYKITGTDGNVYTWKTAGYMPERAASIKGTVKAHTEYRGVKQTELTRCKVTEKTEKEPENHPAPSNVNADAIDAFLAYCNS